MLHWANWIQWVTNINWAKEKYLFWLITNKIYELFLPYPVQSFLQGTTHEVKSIIRVWLWAILIEKDKFWFLIADLLSLDLSVLEEYEGMTIDNHSINYYNN